jgi:hypothetical protein
MRADPAATGPGGFERLGPLGTGESADVFRAIHLASGSTVALKVWRIPFDAPACERFHRALRTMRTLLGHPHVVRVLESRAEVGMQAWTATEVCDETLADRLCGSHPVSAAEAMTIARGLLLGLAALHESCQPVGRISANNVLLRDGRIKVTFPDVTSERPSAEGIRDDMRDAASLLDRVFPADRDPRITAVLRAAAEPGGEPVDADSLQKQLTSVHLKATPRSTAPLPGLQRGSTRRRARAVGTVAVVAALATCVLGLFLSTRRPAGPDPRGALPASPTHGEAGCIATALTGSLSIPPEGTNAGGPNFTTASCDRILLRLTDSTVAASARACLEAPEASSTIRCGDWVPLSLRRWATLLGDVQAGSRWRLEIYASGGGSVRFEYTT